MKGKGSSLRAEKERHGYADCHNGNVTDSRIPGMTLPPTRHSRECRDLLMATIIPNDPVENARDRIIFLLFDQDTYKIYFIVPIIKIVSRKVA